MILIPKGKRIRKYIIDPAEKTLAKAQTGMETADASLCKRVLIRVSENSADGLSDK